MDILAAIAAIGVILIITYYLGVFRGAPFLPTYTETAERMIEKLNLKQGEKFADLGSGDGRLVIAAALKGAEAHGYEINPVLVLWSRQKINRLKLDDRAFIHWKSFWRENFQSYSAISIFGITGIMERLSQKLSRELKPGARVACNIFPLPGWEGEKDRGIYYYQKS